MNNLPQVFNYEDSPIRVVMINGEPWWVAKDVCDILELGNPSQALSRVEDDEKNTLILNDGTPGNPNTAVVNEPGLYALILGSRKPEAKAFKRWITHEVIPQIRRTGTYAAPSSIEDLIIMQAQSVKELKAQVSRVEERALAAHHRLDTMDAINTIGDPQQRLNAMIRKYAYDKGVKFNIAWNDFKQRFNTAFHTNIEARRINYAGRNSIKKLTMPEFLMKAGLIEDALRVADKMLNRREAI